MIEREIDRYVQQFAHYTEAKEMYETTKQRAKGVDIFLQEETDAIAERKLAEDEALQICQEELHQLEIEKATYDILKAKQLKEKLRSTYYERQVAYEEAKSTHNRQKVERANLQYAKRKKDLTIYEQQKNRSEE